MKSTWEGYYLIVGLLEGMDSERLSGGVSVSDRALSRDGSLFKLLEFQNNVSTKRYTDLSFVLG